MTHSYKTSCPSVGDKHTCTHSLFWKHTLPCFPKCNSQYKLKSWQFL